MWVELAEKFYFYSGKIIMCTDRRDNKIVRCKKKKKTMRWRWVWCDDDYEKLICEWSFMSLEGFFPQFMRHAWSPADCMGENDVMLLLATAAATLVGYYYEERKDIIY